MTSLHTRATSLIQRVDALGDEALRIFTRFEADEILREALALDARYEERSALPLFGLFVSVKDLFDETGKRTTAGSRLFAERPPACDDADVIYRLKRAGALIIGRTSMSEFAYSGVGLNPHHGTPGCIFDRSLIPGGSSSGAALGIAHGLCDIGLGTDTGGSVRLPAAVNGLYGLKPSQSAVSLSGVHPLSATYDSVGPLAPSLALLKRCFQVVRQTENSEVRTTSIDKPLRLAIPEHLFTNDLDESIAADFRAIQQQITTAGHRLETVDMSFLDDKLFAIRAIVSAEAHALYKGSLSLLEDIGDPHVLSRIRFAESLTEKDLRDAYLARATAVESFSRAMTGFDALLAPTIAMQTPTISETEAQFDRINPTMLRNTAMINLVDGCALTLPVSSVSGCPTPAALMICQATAKDDQILAVADLLDELLN
ncbi:MAG: amidase family protein [Granulosicoccus sp.]